METVLNRLSDYPRELADIINFQDEDRETALTMVARCCSKRLVKLLIDHDADPKIANRDGKSTEDYILEDERFRSSPVMPSCALAMSFRNAQAAYPPPTQASAVYAFAPVNGDHMPLHHSNAAQTISMHAIMDMASMLDSLAASFDQELRDKERDLNQAHALLSNIQAQILDSQRAIGQLKVQCQGLDKACTKLQEMETELSAKMGVAAHATLGTSARRSYSQQFSTRMADMGGIFILVFPTIPPPLPRGLHRTTPSHRQQTQFFRLERLRGGKLFFQ